MRWKLPAKLNWDLRVLGRRADGFHELRSWFVACGLFDELQVVPADADSLVLSGPEATRAGPIEENLVQRAIAAWREAGGEAPPLSFHLKKTIPVGAGLGGGSSDGAGTLLAAQSFASRPLDAETLARVALELGSDVPFFLGGHDIEWRGGRGERLLARHKLPHEWVTIVVPEATVRTADLFRRLDVAVWDGEDPPPPSTPQLPGPNDLEPVACAAVRPLATLATSLRRLDPFVMTGSGSAFFCERRTRKAAKQLAQRAEALEGIRCTFAVPLLASAAAAPMEDA